MAVGRDRLGQGLVEEFLRSDKWSVQLKNAVNGDVA